jgi:hypothetical protein
MFRISKLKHGQLNLWQGDIGRIPTNDKERNVTAQPAPEVLGRMAREVLSVVTQTSPQVQLIRNTY